MPEEKGETH